jgi:hypothetical protein
VVNKEAIKKITLTHFTVGAEVAITRGNTQSPRLHVRLCIPLQLLKKSSAQRLGSSNMDCLDIQVTLTHSIARSLACSLVKPLVITLLSSSASSWIMRDFRRVFPSWHAQLLLLSR